MESQVLSVECPCDFFGRFLSITNLSRLSMAQIGDTFSNCDILAHATNQLIMWLDAVE